MSKSKKLLDKLLANNSANTNINFDDLVNLIKKLGFTEHEARSGSHRIFSKKGIPEILNLQEKDGQAKPYQVRQIREIVTKYQLNLSEDE